MVKGRLEDTKWCYAIEIFPVPVTFEPVVDKYFFLRTPSKLGYLGCHYLFDRFLQLPILQERMNNSAAFSPSSPFWHQMWIVDGKPPHQRDTWKFTFYIMKCWLQAWDLWKWSLNCTYYFSQSEISLVSKDYFSITSFSQQQEAVLVAISTLWMTFLAPNSTLASTRHISWTLKYTKKYDLYPMSASCESVNLYVVQHRIINEFTRDPFVHFKEMPAKMGNS